MRLSAAATLYQFSCFTYHLACIQTVLLDHVIAQHHTLQWLFLSYCTNTAEQILRYCLTNLENQIFGSSCIQWQLSCNDFHAIDFTSLLYELVFGTCHGLRLECFDILLHRIMLIDVFLNDTLQILGIVEQSADGLNGVLQVIEQFFTFLSSLCLNTAYTCSNTAFRDNLEHTDSAGALCMDTTTELCGRTETNYTYLIAIFLAEERYSSQFLSFLDRSIAVLIQRKILTNHIIHDTFYLTNFFIGYFLEVREVKTQGIRTDK